MEKAIFFLKDTLDAFQEYYPFLVLMEGKDFGAQYRLAEGLMPTEVINR